MKTILPALLACLTLSVSFAKDNGLDPNDPESLERIIAEAIVEKEKPLGYTGWVKEMRGNGRIAQLAQYKDGKAGRASDGVVRERANGVGAKLQGRQANDSRSLEAKWREVSCDQRRGREWNLGLVQGGWEGMVSLNLQERRISLRLKQPEGVPPP
jgi:hypothetical protein